MAAYGIPIGPAGTTLRINLLHIRTSRHLSRPGLAGAVREETGRALPEIAIRRIEEGNRRVDVDDLIALAVALDITPVDLLIPGSADDDTTYRAAPRLEMTAGVARAWLGGQILRRPQTALELAEAIRWMPQQRARETARMWSGD
jgi:hypothetical protein